MQNGELFCLKEKKSSPDINRPRAKVPYGAKHCQAKVKNFSTKDERDKVSPAKIIKFVKSTGFY